MCGCKENAARMYVFVVRYTNVGKSTTAREYDHTGKYTANKQMSLVDVAKLTSLEQDETFAFPGCARDREGND